MSEFTVNNNQIINGHLPEIPPETTRLVVNYCPNLTEIPDFLPTVEELKISLCENLKSLELNSHLKKAEIINCNKLATLTNLSAALEGLNISSCQNLKKLELKAGVKKIDLFSCEKLEEILDPHLALEELSATNCENLGNLNFNEGLRKIKFARCEALSEIVNLPSTLEEITIKNCHNLRALKLNDFTKKAELDSCEKLQAIDLSSRLEELKIRRCDNLESLQIKEGIKKVEINSCTKLKTIPLPSTIEELKINNCLELENLELNSGIKNLDLSSCRNLRTVTNFPSNLERLDLTNCLRLEATPELIFKLSELENNGCEMSYPPSLDPGVFGNVITAKLNKICANQRRENEPDFTNIKRILEMILKEETDQRSNETTSRKRINEIALLTLPALEILEKNPHLLPLVNELAETFLDGCVNQPVRFWSEFCALMAIAAEEDFEQKLEATKQIFTLDQIVYFIATLPERKVATMFEAEAGNALYREVHKELVDKKILEKPWLGVPGPVAYENQVQDLLRKDLIKIVADQVIEQIFSLNPTELAENMATRHYQSWGEICFPKQIREIKETYSAQRRLLDPETTSAEEFKKIKNDEKTAVFEETRRLTSEQFNSKNPEEETKENQYKNALRTTDVEIQIGENEPQSNLERPHSTLYQRLRNCFSIFNNSSTEFSPIARDEESTLPNPTAQPRVIDRLRRIFQRSNSGGQEN